MKKNDDKKIALFAGALNLPFLARDTLRKNGWEVFVIGLKNFYDPKLLPDMEIRIGNGGRAMRECARRGIKKLTFVGALGHINLSDIIPDFWSAGILLSVMKNQKGSDSMATSFIAAMEKKGYEVVAAQRLAPELAFERPGVQTRAKPAARDKKDIDRAVDASRAIGRADIGASVVVDRQVIAVEAAEGTRRMLARAIELRGERKRQTRSGVFAKMTKPGQDIRIDAPAIGVDTIKAAASAKLRGIVVNAKTCFVIDKDEVIRTADKLGLFILAV
jgi:DUF1009 family protein